MLSIILHNLLVCMLMVGLSPHETTEIVHRWVCGEGGREGEEGREGGREREGEGGRT